MLLSLLLSEGCWSTDFEPRRFLGMLGIGALVSLLAAFVAYGARAVDRSGAVAGWVLATTIFTFLGWRGLVLLVAFVALGSGTTRLGYQRKAAAKLAQAGGGRRSARHAVANAGVASLVAVVAATTPYPELYLPAFVAALAAATGDTVSSEIGQLRGRRTVLITNLAPVEPGTDGGISLAGSLAGLAGSLAVAALGHAVGFYPLGGIVVVTVAAAIGVTVDSLLGATLERRGLLDNDGVNFANTLAAALAAAGLAAALQNT
ncbi:MAG: TIGR00297 family protein [bacterium]|nr:TIGR00297 family protein [bacterium]